MGRAGFVPVCRAAGVTRARPEVRWAARQVCGVGCGCGLESACDCVRVRSQRPAGMCVYESCQQYRTRIGKTPANRQARHSPQSPRRRHAPGSGEGRARGGGQLQPAHAAAAARGGAPVPQLQRLVLGRRLAARLPGGDGRAGRALPAAVGQGAAQPPGQQRGRGAQGRRSTGSAERRGRAQERVL